MIIPPDDAGGGPVSPGGMWGMQLVDSAHDKEILIGDSLYFRRLPIHTGSVDGKQVCLVIDGNLKELTGIINDTRKCDGQNIFPILSDRIDMMGIKEEEIVLKLSAKDKFFHIW